MASKTFQGMASLFGDKTRELKESLDFLCKIIQQVQYLSVN
jgi:hypothetical protein